MRRGSGNVMGTHQKIDRLAMRYVKKKLPPGLPFPKIGEILHFEGNNGPDGIKRKSPARDEPWHYFDPNDPRDTGLLTMVEDHSFNLTEALRSGNRERAAFEAAWLAHALVDGLTPAHHYPLEEKLEQLRGEGLETRRTIRDKLIISGYSRRDTLRRNWEFWGAKGVMTTHVLFEIGVATTIAPLTLPSGRPSQSEYERVAREGIGPYFLEAARHVSRLNMYERFHKKGWTPKLARQTREDLVPLIIRTVALAWYGAARAAVGES